MTLKDYIFPFRNRSKLLGGSPHLDIQVVPGKWGQAKTEDVYLLLDNVAQHFLKHLTTPFSAIVQVECHPNRSTGQVTCRSALRNAHIVQLATHDYCSWSFQFAHELCHLISGYHLLRSRQN